MGRGGDRIKEIRDQLKISQGALAKLLKVSTKSVGRWERGETDPKYDDVQSAEKLLRRNGGQLVAAEGRAPYKVTKRKRSA